MAYLDRKTSRRRIHNRIRRTLRGSAERPRLAVHFSNRNVYAQLIDDDKGITIASACTLDQVGASELCNAETAAKIGKLIAERAKSLNVASVVFDRGGHRFHGKVKALADAAREGGLQF
jgi:large subunit ribosomal protein L18